MSDRPRIGLIGFGYIGQYVNAQITEDLADFAAKPVDLVVERAHPDVTRRHGRAFLETTDYVPLSLTAFADPALEAELLETGR